MANIPENTTNPVLRPVTRLETTTKVFGGEYIENDEQQRGISNLQAIELAERDQYILSRVGEAYVPESGDIPAKAGIAGLDTSGKVPKAQLPTDTVCTEASQTLKNKTIDAKDNTILNTPVEVNTTQTYNFTKETNIVIKSNINLTLGTAPYIGYKVNIGIKTSGNYAFVKYGSVSDMLYDACPMITYEYTYIGWQPVSGTQFWIVNTDSSGWNVFRGFGTYFFHFEYADSMTDFGTPANYCTVTVTWKNVSEGSASAICWTGADKGKLWSAALHTIWSSWKEVVDTSFAQTLTNKTIDANSNTLLNTVTSKNISNCITAIPQDINLTLSSGTLTLKAGSKMYIPNGKDGSTLLFNTVIIQNDITANSIPGGTQTCFILPSENDNAVNFPPTKYFFSGDTVPTGFSGNFALWYDTDSNLIKRTDDSGANWYVHNDYPLPLGVATVANYAVSSIDQVFNGMGYIGSTAFVLPGLKMLFPNGRNADGTLKSIEHTVTSVQTITNSSTGTRILVHGGGLGDNSITDYSYDESENYLLQIPTGALKSWAVIATCYRTSGVISNFRPKTAFHAVDWNDIMKGSWREHTATLAGGLSGTVKYIVRNGVCYVAINDLDTGATGTNQQICNLPKSKSTQYVNSIVFEGATGAPRGCVYIPPTGYTMFANISVTGIAYGSFSYPVADDYVES